MHRFALCTLVAGLGLPLSASAEVEKGFHPKLAVAQPTRLDWRFVASGFGDDKLELPADYRSQQQRFQLYVPPTYNKSKAWPLIIFVSPSDAPLGWRQWQKPCVKNRMLFCAAYGAGNRTPVAKRIRIILDVVDHVRREFHIDPEQSYVTGFSGGGRIACTIAFALPEYFGGLIPVCGTNPLNRLDYLRHRARDRLSVAFVTGEKDFNREENEAYAHPLLKDLGFRTRLWVVDGMGHAVPKAAVLTDVLAYLDEDLQKRRKSTGRWIDLRHPPDDKLAPTDQAQYLLDAAKQSLRIEAHTWRGVTMLQGVIARWGRTKPADEARAMLKALQKDKEKLRLVESQGGDDERQTLAAQARAFERFGRLTPALRAYKMLAERHADSGVGQQAKIKVQQLAKRLSKAPYLGVRFVGASTRLADVVADSPADKADLRPDDRIKKIGATAVRSLRDVRAALRDREAGDDVDVDVDRDGKTIKLKVTLGKLPS